MERIEYVRPKRKDGESYGNEMAAELGKRSFYCGLIWNGLTEEETSFFYIRNAPVSQCILY